MSNLIIKNILIFKKNETCVSSLLNGLHLKDHPLYIFDEVVTLYLISTLCDIKNASILS